MSDSDRGWGNKAVEAFFIVLALLGTVSIIYALGSLSGHQEGRSVEAAARHEADGKQQAIQACTSEPVSRRAECIYDTIAATEDAKRAEQDLQAQQGMHFWAVSMAFIGLLQTGVAGAALWFLREDLRQNRRSAEMQLRAYVRLKPLEFDLAVGRRLMIPISVSNYGSTPALDAVFVHRVVFVTGQPECKWTYPHPKIPAEAKRPHIVIHPGDDGQAICDSTDPLSGPMRSSILSGRTVIQCRCTMFYKDVFGNNCHTTLAFEFCASGHQDGLFIRMSSEGNSAT